MLLAADHAKSEASRIAIWIILVLFFILIVSPIICYIFDLMFKKVLVFMFIVQP